MKARVFTASRTALSVIRVNIGPCSNRPAFARSPALLASTLSSPAASRLPSKWRLSAIGSPGPIGVLNFSRAGNVSALVGLHSFTTVRCMSVTMIKTTSNPANINGIGCNTLEAVGTEGTSVKTKRRVHTFWKNDNANNANKLTDKLESLHGTAETGVRSFSSTSVKGKKDNVEAGDISSTSSDSVSNSTNSDSNSTSASTTSSTGKQGEPPKEDLKTIIAKYGAVGAVVYFLISMALLVSLYGLCKTFGLDSDYLLDLVNKTKATFGFSPSEEKEEVKPSWIAETFGLDAPLLAIIFVASTPLVPLEVAATLWISRRIVLAIGKRGVQIAKETAKKL